jgi:hypothetical protein
MDFLEMVGLMVLLIFLVALLAFGSEGITYTLEQSDLENATTACAFAGYDTAVADYDGNEYCVYQESLTLLEAN